MSKSYNHTKYGGAGCKQATFDKSTIIANKDPTIWRKDTAGNVINLLHHGKHTSKYGWDIDHICPKAQGGSDYIENLQALNCSLNRSCGNKINKPGLSIQLLHQLRKQKVIDNRDKKLNEKSNVKTNEKADKKQDKIKMINEGDTLFVKQSPLTHSKLAKIMKININPEDTNQNTIIVFWLYSSYQQELVYDLDMFENMPTIKRGRARTSV